MADKASEIINYLIGLAITGSMVVILSRKKREDPDMKVSGTPVGTFILLGTFGLAIMLAMLVYVLLK